MWSPLFSSKPSGLCDHLCLPGSCSTQQHMLITSQQHPRVLPGNLLRCSTPVTIIQDRPVKQPVVPAVQLDNPAARVSAPDALATHLHITYIMCAQHHIILFLLIPAFGRVVLLNITKWRYPIVLGVLIMIAVLSYPFIYPLFPHCGTGLCVLGQFLIWIVISVVFICILVWLCQDDPPNTLGWWACVVGRTICTV